MEKMHIKFVCAILEILKKKKYKDVCEDEDIINTNRKLVNSDKNIDKKMFYKQFPIKIAIKNLHQ
jgi:hypothetical protein